LGPFARAPSLALATKGAVAVLKADGKRKRIE
jgi:hypothetical protein